MDKPVGIGEQRPGRVAMKGSRLSGKVTYNLINIVVSWDGGDPSVYTKERFAKMIDDGTLIPS